MKQQVWYETKPKKFLIESFKSLFLPYPTVIIFAISLSLIPIKIIFYDLKAEFFTLVQCTHR